MMFPESELMTQARRAVDEERFEDAQGILINVVVREPQNDEAWILLAEVLPSPERKMECLERARRISPRNPAVLRSIAELKASLAASAFDQEPALAEDKAVPETPAAPPAPRTELAVPLLEHGDVLARELIMTTEPGNTRALGLEIVHMLDQANSYDATAARRWARSAGHDALVKYERTLSILITNLPQSDPQLTELRNQRQRALAFLK
jgi:hypothetical protein